jgi:hypothetical protein
MSNSSVPVERATLFPTRQLKVASPLDPTSSNSDTERKWVLILDGSVSQAHDLLVVVETRKRSNVVELNSPIFAERLQERRTERANAWKQEMTTDQ